MFLWWFQVFSVMMLKSLLNGRNILIVAILCGLLYCYVDIQSKQHTITEQTLTITQQQLQIQQMTVTKAQQQEIMNQTTKQPNNYLRLNNPSLKQLKS